MPGRFRLNIIGHHRDPYDLTTQQVVEPARKEPRPGEPRIAADFVAIPKRPRDPVAARVDQLRVPGPEMRQAFVR